MCVCVTMGHRYSHHKAKLLLGNMVLPMCVSGDFKVVSGSTNSWSGLCPASSVVR